MSAFLLKTALAALIVAAASELAKRSTAAATILISLPLSSILALSFLFAETKDAGRVAALSTGIFLALLPSFLFLLTLPFLLRRGWNYWAALAASCAAMTSGYAVYASLLRRFGIAL